MNIIQMDEQVFFTEDFEIRGEAEGGCPVDFSGLDLPPDFFIKQ